MRRKVPKWVLIGSLLLQVMHVTYGQLNDVCRHQKWSSPGTVKLLVVAGIHGNNDGGCGDISTTNFPLLVALDWILDFVNGVKTGSPSYLPNITLGYDVYDNCDNEDLTVDLLYPGFNGINPECANQSDTENDDHYAGIFSLSTPEATRAMTRLAGSLPVFRSLGPSPGLSSQFQTNLIQTVPSYTEEAEALVQFLVKMKWNFVFLVYTDDEYGLTTREVFSAKSRDNEICIHLEQALKVKDVKFSETRSFTQSIITEVYRQISNGYNKNIVVVYLGNVRGAAQLLKSQENSAKPVGAEISWVFSQNVGEELSMTSANDFNQNNGFSISYLPIFHRDFYDHFIKDLQDDSAGPISTLKKEYLRAIGCDSVPPNSCHVVNHTFNFLTNFIDSMLLTTKMLRNLHDSTCQTYGLCDAMRDKLLEKKWYLVPNSLRFKADFEDRYLPENYRSRDRSLSFTQQWQAVLSHDSPLIMYKLPTTSDKVAEFDGSELKTFRDASSFSTSACNLPKHCPVCRQHYDLRYSYLHGDKLLLGLFSIHQYGNTPFECGPVRHDTNDAITVSSFMESINFLREETGRNYGGIAFDDCYNAFNTSAFLADLFSKKIILRDPSTGEDIDFDKVFVIVGALSSPVSLVIGDLSTALGIPMISYGASSPELDNTARYPFFLRTVPSDSRQVRGIVQLIQKLNVTFVAALYINDAYGKNGIKTLMKEANRVGICIDPVTAISQDMDNTSLVNVLTNLYLKGARVIVYFSIDSLALRILEILSTEFRDNQPLVFIASEAWGTNQNLLEGQLGQRAKGSLVFNVETMPQDSIKFKNFLSGLNSSHSQHNRWVPKFFEDAYNCDFITSFDKSRPNRPPCEPILKLDEVTVNSLYQDQRGVHVIHAVHASINGFHKVVNNICRGISVCHDLRENGRLLKEAIQATELDSSYGNLVPFDATGSGNIGFTIFNIQRDNVDGRIRYVKIGSFSKEDELILSSEPVFYNDLHQPATLSEMFPYNIHCSSKDVCSSVCQTNTLSTTPTPEVSTEASAAHDDSDSTTLVITVVLAVLLAIVVVALVLVIVLLFRRQSHHISNETFSKSEISTSHKDLSSNNIYNEVSDYRESRTSGFGSVSVLSEGPVTYADIRQRQLSSNMFRYPETSSELLLSPVSTKSLSPGTSRPSRPFVEHTRSLSDSKILDASLGALRATHTPSAATRHLTPSTRSKGLDNLHDINYSSQFPNSHMLGYGNKHIAQNIAHGYYDDSETEDNLDPDSGFQHSQSTHFEANPDALNYITARDLMDHSDEEESADDESEGSAKRTNSEFSEQNAAKVVQSKHEPYNKSLISPSDQEVAAINFPGNERVTYSNKRKPEMQETPGDDQFIRNNRGNNALQNESHKALAEKRMSDHPRNNNRTSMSSVPDIIPHDVNERHLASPDSDEQEVFII